MAFIIAEVGSNWESLQDCFDSVEKAQKCGADAVKFQFYTGRELYGSDVTIPGELPVEWIPEIAKKAEDVNIEFMCTAFSPQGYEIVNPYVKRHKVASAEMTHKEIFHTLLWMGKPVYASTGMHSLDEILRLAFNFPKLTLLYCVSNYPAFDTNLLNISYLQKFGFSVGYSCHERGIMPAYYANKYFKAEVIEKHFKIREMSTPDNLHSVLPDDFKRMVNMIRHSNEALPAYELYSGYDHQQDAVAKYAKRRLTDKGFYRSQPGGA